MNAPATVAAAPGRDRTTEEFDVTDGIEEWRPVVGYEGRYEVSDQGRVRSLTRYVDHWCGGQRIIRGRMLRAFTSNKNVRTAYKRVGLSGSPCDVHILVLTTFVGPRPTGLVACHRNGDHNDNRAENLRWDTRSANSYDDIRNGVHPTGSKTRCSKGHEYTPENTRFDARTGHRRCKTCHREDEKARYHRRVVDE